MGHVCQNTSKRLKKRLKYIDLLKVAFFIDAVHSSPYLSRAAHRLSSAGLGMLGTVGRKSCDFCFLLSNLNRELPVKSTKEAPTASLRVMFPKGPPIPSPNSQNSHFQPKMEHNMA